MTLLQRIGIFCGVIAPWWWATMIVICAALWPHYDHTQQFISELGAHGSPTQTLMNWGGFYVTGVLYLLFGVALVPCGDTAEQSKQPIYRLATAIMIALAGITRLGTGYFPCEAGCAAIAGSTDHIWHHIFARIGYGCLTLASLTWAIHSWRINARYFAAYSFATFVATIPLLLLLQNSIEPRINTGFYQRAVTLVLSSWIFILAATEMRQVGETSLRRVGQHV
jgi:hypothetical protein